MADLTSEGLCSIIETGAKFGLQRLKFGELDICFGAYQPGQFEALPAPGPQLANLAEQSEILPEEEERIKRLRLDNLPIEDPLEYERQIASGELTEEEDTEGLADGEEA